MTRLLRHLELVLSGVGLLVIGSVPLLVEHGGVATAIVATIVGTLHGVIFWLVRRRQRQVREATILEIQHMLNDKINNQLGVILLNIDEGTERSADERMRLVVAQRAIKRISHALRALSEESLRRWHAHEKDEELA